MSELARAIPGQANPRSYNGHYMRAGKEAEKIVMDWLRANPQIVGLDDLRGLREMQTADVDCSLQLSDGRAVLAEIKSDWHLGKSGNVLFEVLRINHTAQSDKAVTLGWSARSPATWLLYYAPQVNSIYQCRFDDFRRCFQTYTAEARKTSRLDYIETDAIKSTVNVLIPWKYCEKAFRVHALKE